MLVDSHCHLDYYQTDLDAILARAQAAGVRRLVTISTLVSQFDTYRALAERNPGVFFSVGTHPHQVGEEPDVPVSRLVALSAHPRCIAIGEAGLDYFYDRNPRDLQQAVFRTHIAAARDSGLPLVIHARSADEDMIAILKDEIRAGTFTAVLHCFSSGRELAEVGLELGLYLSFSGILTFRRSEELRAIAAMAPIERLLVETDAPYLAPEPFRGKRNEPAHVGYTARVLAEVKGMDEAALIAATTANFERLFAKVGRDELVANAEGRAS
ncbi:MULTISPECIES: TatD family hydrolase [unclassified Chelatococcus]|uniref:TatD family hydrolase n=1 Tax=unclassified Chelatococcus TaxID=2638111 RepID=UPI001BCA8C63|nr:MULTISPECIES: TatD family hydrolase [unclassified Chelatococcus]MBS7699254.1 TatD family hydrolase [Chelatococcus sp. YT9]MBX3557614.1 TatD family hydrolase [Chelatococcus sp.]